MTPKYESKPPQKPQRHRRPQRSPLDDIQLMTVRPATTKDERALECWETILRSGSQEELDSFLIRESGWVDAVNNKVNEESLATPSKIGRPKHWVDTPTGTAFLRIYESSLTPDPLRLGIRNLFIESHVPFSRYIKESPKLLYLINKHLNPQEKLMAKLYHGIGVEGKPGGYSLIEITSELGLPERQVVKALSKAADVTIRNLGRDIEFEKEPRFFSNDDVRYFENIQDKYLFKSNKNRRKFMEDYREFVKIGDLNRFLIDRFTDPGKRLRFLRIIGGVKQGEIADMAGLIRNTVIRYETGDLNVITKENILGKHKGVTQVVRNLNTLLKKLGYKEGVCMFLWGKNLKEVIDEWGITKLGDKLRAVRRLGGKTSRQLREETGIGRMQIASYEKDGLDAINPEELQKDHTQVVKTIKNLKKLLATLSGEEKISVPEVMFNKSGLQLLDEWGIGHQGKRLRILRRLAGEGYKELAGEVDIQPVTLQAYEDAEEIIGKDVARAYNFDFRMVRHLNKLIEKLGLKDLSEVLWAKKTSELADELKLGPGGKLRLARLMKGKGVGEFANESGVSRETIEEYERLRLNQLSKENILQGESNQVKVVKNLTSLLNQLSVEEGVSEFMWGSPPKEMLKKWKIRKPGDKLRVLRVLEGKAMMEVCAEETIGFAGLVAYERLDAPPLQDVYLGGRRVLLPETVRNLEKLCSRYKTEEGVSQLLWNKPAEKILRDKDLRVVDRVRFALTMSGEVLKDYITLIRYLERKNIRRVQEIDDFWIPQLEEVYDVCKEKDVVRDWKDIFPQNKKDEIRRIFKER